MSPPPSSQADSAGAPEPVVLIPKRHTVRVGATETKLTRTQFRLIELLITHPGRAFTRAELVAQGIGYLVTERTVDVHIKEVRRKLGAAGGLLETVRHVGYRWAGPTPPAPGSLSE